MSDEVRATNCRCDDHVGGIGGFGDNDWLEWIVIIFVVWWLFFGGNNWFNRGCCR